MRRNELRRLNIEEYYDDLLKVQFGIIWEGYEKSLCVLERLAWR